MATSGITVKRWRRYGQDRLYVARADDLKIGWWDLRSGEAHPESSTDLALLIEAVRGWKAARPDDAQASPAAPPNGEFPPRSWVDLSTNAPGAEVRKQAVAAKEAAPVRTFLARALGVHTDERAWRLGADGEERVAARLAKVAKKDPRWRFLHAIPVGVRGSDMDHLIVGPGGVFTVNAKHHPRKKIWVAGDTFMVDGHRHPYIRNSRHEAARAARLLSEAAGFPIDVEALIVTVGAEEVTVKDPPAGVHVVRRMRVTRWLLRHADIYSEQTVEAVYDTARRLTTWES